MSATLAAVLCTVMVALLHAYILRSWGDALRAAINGVDERPGEELIGLSVIVPVRNEEDGVVPCLQDLHAQKDRAQLDVIVVDDGSTDRTAERVRGLKANWPDLRFEQLGAQEGKKAAIERGMELAMRSVVLLTDGDTRCSEDRTTRIRRAWSAAPPHLLLLPVFMDEGAGWLARYQQQEQAALLAVAAGSALSGNALLANGANLAVDREAFRSLGGYAQDRHWASGDDMFLLQAMRRSGRRVRYLADRAVAVTVRPESTWAGWWAQRLRWAGKMRAYRSPAPGPLGYLPLGFRGGCSGSPGSSLTKCMWAMLSFTPGACSCWHGAHGSSPPWRWCAKATGSNKADRTHCSRYWR
ncbi:MAG: glycosyltransferase [Flavobacteriales bacterium]|nr:glycosyltransferase [Flavobacteriales bacterium]